MLPVISGKDASDKAHFTYGCARERGAAEEKSQHNVDREHQHPAQLQHPGDGERLPGKGLNAFVGKRLRADTQSAARLKQQQAEKHQAFAEDAIDSGKMRQDTRAR